MAIGDRIEIALKSDIPTQLPANGGIAETISTTLPITKGGTGATTAGGALVNLGACPRVSRANWVGNSDTMVVGEIAWRNYGNSHTIFDASSSTTPSGTACNPSNSTNAWALGYPTLMGFNGTSTHGVRVDSARVADSASNMSFGTNDLAPGVSALSHGSFYFMYE
ncbi:hypothetical protein [Anaerocolumna xylanovorans]|uniref:Uncharacterized protein n=1 Tax=Anaerocolumna xylanovorans DSM 12503 TaxID=1121345 RepID=A0A1M7YM86_9FIRM|nr:hypothetical protein [Anaerocolumna xylanovorans]SHO53710.1 hypothetical protein SAMN02745217_04249 [Anaerocolumna xylanovorans DSM 12503]